MQKICCFCFWECRERKREQRLEVKRPGADGTVERPSDDHSLCAVSLTAQQDSSSATITGDAWSKLRRAQRSDGVNQGTLALILRSCAVCCSGAGCKIDRRMEVCWARLCGEKCCSIYTCIYISMLKGASNHPPVLIFRLHSTIIPKRPHARCTRYRHLPPPLPNVKPPSRFYVQAGQ